MNLNSVIDGKDIINELFPNIPVLIAHVFASIILLLVLWKLVYAPFRTSLHARHLAIKGKLDEAAEKQSLANQDRSAAFQLLNSAKLEADSIISSASTKAHDERKEIIDKAFEEAMRITNQSKHDIARQKKEAEKQIKKEIEDISLELTKKILNSEINQNKHQKLINDFINELKK